MKSENAADEERAADSSPFQSLRGPLNDVKIERPAGSDKMLRGVCERARRHVFRLRPIVITGGLFSTFFECDIYHLIYRVGATYL